MSHWMATLDLVMSFQWLFARYNSAAAVTVGGDNDYENQEGKEGGGGDICIECLIQPGAGLG